MLCLMIEMSTIPILYVVHSKARDNIVNTGTEYTPGRRRVVPYNSIKPYSIRKVHKNADYTVLITVMHWLKSSIIVQRLNMVVSIRVFYLANICHRYKKDVQGCELSRYMKASNDLKDPDSIENKHSLWWWSYDCFDLRIGLLQLLLTVHDVTYVCVCINWGNHNYRIPFALLQECGCHSSHALSMGRWACMQGRVRIQTF